MSKFEKQLKKANDMRDTREALLAREKAIKAMPDRGEAYLAWHALSDEIGTVLKQYGRLPYEHYAMLPLYIAGDVFVNSVTLVLGGDIVGRGMTAQKKFERKFSKDEIGFARDLKKIRDRADIEVKLMEEKDRDQIAKVAVSPYREEITKKFPAMRAAFTWYARECGPLPSSQKPASPDSKLLL